MDQGLLIDTAAEMNLVPGDYFNLWDDLADWQMNALQVVGLKPKHRLLDIGCGAMRLGFHAVDYLDDGHYYGVDAFAPYVALAERLATRLDVRKRFTLLVSDDFAFDRFATKFQYANAQSVFTHLSAQECHRCMEALRGVMLPGGKFLFTYLIGIPATQGFLYGGQQPMRRLAITDEGFFEELGALHGAQFEKLTLSHPTGQEVGSFLYNG